jgi:predicted glycosyltransferase
MSDVHAPISHRSTQTAERDSVPHAVSGACGEGAPRTADLLRTPSVTQADPGRTDGNPSVSSAQACASAELKRILVYSHDTFGLGNIKRMLDISKHLVAAYTNVSVLIISGSPIVHSFRIPPHVDYIKLPCLTRTLDGFYDVKFLGLTYDETIRLRTTLITSALLDFSPDLILVDKKPFGLNNELSPGLRLLHGRGALPKVVLLLRDILDNPETTTAAWERNHYHEAVRCFYDRILVVGSPEIFDLATEYKFPASSESKMQFCGYLRRDRGSQTRDQIRCELGVHDEHLVLVTGGGGQDGYQLLANYIQGLNYVPKGTKIKSLLICGPEMSEQHRRRIRDAAGHPQLVIQEFNNDMMGCIDAADLVVSMAGYNTICEILSLHKRAIVVPRVRPVQEQWMRAERMARLGLLRTIHPDHVTPMQLMHAVAEELNADDGGPTGAYEVDLNGMSRVATSLYGLLDDSAPVSKTSMT